MLLPRLSSFSATKSAIIAISAIVVINTLLPANNVALDGEIPSTVLSRLIEDESRLPTDVFSDFNDDVFSSLAASSLRLPRRIDIDLTESPQGYEINADLPGVQKGDIKVEVTMSNILKVTVEKQSATNVEKSKAQYSERMRGFLSRSISLPEDADAKKLTATYKNGVLTLVIPKLATGNSASGFTVEVK
jgi:HSP20 family protein